MFNPSNLDGWGFYTESDSNSSSFKGLLYFAIGPQSRGLLSSLEKTPPKNWDIFSCSFCFRSLIDQLDFLCTTVQILTPRFCYLVLASNPLLVHCWSWVSGLPAAASAWGEKRVPWSEFRMISSWHFILQVQNIHSWLDNHRLACMTRQQWDCVYKLRDYKAEAETDVRLIPSPPMSQLGNSRKVLHL